MGQKWARPLRVSSFFHLLLAFLLNVERWDWESPRSFAPFHPFRERLYLARLPERCVLSPCWPVRSLGPFQLNTLPFTFPPRLRRNSLSSPFSSRPCLPFFSFIALYTRCACCLSSISSILFAASGRVLDKHICFVPFIHKELHPHPLAAVPGFFCNFTCLPINRCLPAHSNNIISITVL